MMTPEGCRSLPQAAASNSMGGFFFKASYIHRI
jgi:hypothetical protein